MQIMIFIITYQNGRGRLFSLVIRRVRSFVESKIYEEEAILSKKCIYC